MQGRKSLPIEPFSTESDMALISTMALFYLAPPYYDLFKDQDKMEPY